MGLPTTGTPAMGHQSKIWIVETLPFDESSAQCLEFISESMSQSTSLSYNDGIRGTRQMARERVRKSARTVGGTITMTPTQTELRTLLPWILGTNETGSGTSGSPYAYILAETLQEFQILALKVEPSAIHTDEVFLYENCRVARATFSASSGGPLTLSLDIEAETERSYANGSISIGSNPSTPTDVMSGGSSGRSVPSSVPDTDTPFMFYDTGHSNGALTIGNADRECFDWSLTIDNVLDTGRFMNSLDRTNIPSMGLVVSMTATVPFTAAEDELYDADVNSSSPDTNTNLVKFYNSANDKVVQFTMATWNIESRTPTVNGKGEVVLPLSGTVYRKNAATAKDAVGISIWSV